MAALVLTARWLGPHGRGVGVVVLTWTTLVSSIGFLSLGQVCGTGCYVRPAHHHALTRCLAECNNAL